MINKSIKIKCKFCGNLSANCYKIKIYNEQNTLIVNDFTDKYGNFIFNVKYKGIYRIVIINYYLPFEKKCITIFVDKNFIPELYVVFNEFAINKNHLITVNVTDSYYKNLPLTRGKVILRETNK